MIPLSGLALYGLTFAGTIGGSVPDRVADTCVTVSAEVRRHSYGYDHFVILKNGCDTERECWVSTDVSPTAVYLLVGGGTEVRLLTTRGAARRNFSVTTRCEPPADRQTGSAAAGGSPPFVPSALDREAGGVPAEHAAGHVGHVLETGRHQVSGRAPGAGARSADEHDALVLRPTA